MPDKPTIEVQDPPWREVKAWANERIEVHKRVLERIGLSPEETEGVRYAIAELRALLNFPNPSKMSVSISKEPD